MEKAQQKTFLVYKHFEIIRLEPHLPLALSPWQWEPQQLNSNLSLVIAVIAQVAFIWLKVVLWPNKSIFFFFGFQNC